MSSFVFQNLKEYKVQKGGLQAYALLASRNWFRVVADKNKDDIVISERHVFRPQKGFLICGCAPLKNNLTADTIGDAGSQGTQQTIQLFIPGSYDQLHATMETLKNEPLIVLVRDIECGGKYYQLGDGCVGANMSWNYSSGSQPGDFKGYTITITYNGAIQLFDGSFMQYPDEVESSLFLAQEGSSTLDPNRLSENMLNGYTDDLQSIIDYIQSYTDREIIYIAFKDETHSVATYAAEMNFSSIDSFISDIQTWLLKIGAQNTLTVKNGRATYAEGYIGIAIPKGFLSDTDDQIIEDTDDQMLLTENQ